KLGFRTLVQDFAPDARSSDKDYKVIESLDELDALAASLKAAGRFSLAPITDGASAMTATIAGWAFSTAPNLARYVPMRHSGLPDTPNFAVSEVISRIGPLLADAGIEKVGHDLKFAMIALGRDGVVLNGLGIDTEIASYLVDATRSNHALEGLALERADYRMIADEAIRGKGVKAVGLDAVPSSSLLTFAAERSDVPLLLATGLAEDMSTSQLDSVYRDLERPLIPILATIERIGIRVDTDALAVLAVKMQTELDDLSSRIFAAAGGEFNINSPKQLGEVLFERMSLQTGKKTGGTKAFSTAREVLEELALTHEMPALVLKWREIMKLKGTYVDALPLLVHPQTKRVHTTFNQAVAATGRLSSSDPNLQNIPIRTAQGREIRAAFVADPGYVLISADYSQIELRVLAHLSGDEALTEAFRTNIDIHDRTSERVFGVNSGLDPHELRRRAKIINYALLYGKTAFTLAKDIGVEQRAAQEFIDAYFAGYPSVRKFIDQTLEDARSSGVVKTITGRRRLVPELNSRNMQVRMAAERETVNMPIQGTAADVLKKAMIDASSELERYNAGRMQPSRMILTVHDELLFEAPESEADDVAALVKDTMQRAFPLSVPLDVDVGVGVNWREAKP
ncbi:MAG TPA: DNA polymerase, partial [Vicinamibacterales bacterium]|nr:DNA polymerase [Vicinamibacterales bacterium]